MLPAATHTRSDRESVKGRVGGRTQEISRLVGRSLRACIDLAALGENTIALDCDVLQADGGTRTAAITGAYVALADAVTYLGAHGRLADPQPISCAIAAVSVGVVDGRVRLDLPYEEDSRAEVDMNVVATDTGTLVEIQGTGEGATFPRSTLDAMLEAIGRDLLDLPGLHATIAMESRTPAQHFDPTLSAALAARLGGAPLLATGAGHDAGVLAEAGVPSAMLFVRNPTGISHSPEEYAEDADCEAGGAALADVLTDLLTADTLPR